MDQRLKMNLVTLLRLLVMAEIVLALMSMVSGLSIAMNLNG
jgi:hypothetical protein